MEKLNLPPFYVGQKAVYVGTPNTHYAGIYPKPNEIITIAGICPMYEGNYNIKEYPFGKYGQPQSVNYKDLRPLKESKFKAVTFEKICEEVELICEN